MTNVYEQEYQKLKEGPEIAFPVGATRVRILPRLNVKGEVVDPFFVTKVIHWNVGPKKRIVCCRRQLQEPCYVCEMMAQLIANGQPDMAKNMSAGPRYICGAVPLARDDRPSKIMPMGAMILEQLLALARNGDWGPASDPDKGYVITVNREGTGMNDTKYVVQPSPTKEPIDKAWLSNLPDLENYFPMFSYDDQKKIVAGQDVGNSGTTQAATSQVVPPTSGAALLTVASPDATQTSGVVPQIGQSLSAPASAPNAAAAGVPTVITGGESPQVAS